MVLRLGWIAVGLVLLALAAAPLGADDQEAEREVWHFKKGEVERTVDVTGMEDFIRRAVVKRLQGQGFERFDPKRAGTPGRDLAEDARTLARHGGRFPERPGVVGDTPYPRRTAFGRYDLLAAQLGTLLGELEGARPGTREAAAARAGLRSWVRLAATLAGRRGLVLGAFVVAVEPGPGWIVEHAPAGSLGAALGLVPGDRILTADGAAATPDALAAWQDRIFAGTQRTLGLLRTDGRRETWALDWIDRPSSSAPSSPNRR
jgi:hypothetical protein